MTGKKFVLRIMLAGSLLLAGCSYSGDAETSFRQKSGDAKVILYAVYDNPEDKGVFSETFRFYIDNGFVGEIDDGEYIETGLPPGEYTIGVDEMSWSGNIASHSTLATAIKPHEVFYAIEHVRAGQKATLEKIGANIGAKDIAGRKPGCSC